MAGQDKNHDDHVRCPVHFKSRAAIELSLRSIKNSMASRKDQLDRIGPGFYSDRGGALYVDMAEFLAAHGVLDTQEARGAVWQEIYRAFGAIEINEI